MRETVPYSDWWTFELGSSFVSIEEHLFRLVRYIAANFSEAIGVIASVDGVGDLVSLLATMVKREVSISELVSLIDGRGYLHDLEIKVWTDDRLLLLSIRESQYLRIESNFPRFPEEILGSGTVDAVEE